MILISHRGNLNGKNTATENSPQQVFNVLLSGLNCEIDVWKIGNDYFLGHDSPQYWVNEGFLEHNKLWCHAKNMPAFLSMINNNKIHCFWHQNDAVVLTSKGIIWAYPVNPIVKNSIVLFPEIYNQDIRGCLGVCSDLILKYK